MVLVAGDLSPPGSGAPADALHRRPHRRRAGPVLDATPAGRTVYRRARLRGCLGLSRLVRAANAAARSRPGLTAIASRPIDDAIGGSPAYDAVVFGATAAACWRGCADACRPPTCSRSRRAASTAFCSAATAHGDAARAPGRRGRRGRAGVARARPRCDRRAGLRRSRRRPRPRSAPGSRARTFAQRPLTRMLLRRSASFDDAARTFAVVGRSSGDPPPRRSATRKGRPHAAARAGAAPRPGSARSNTASAD